MYLPKAVSNIDSEDNAAVNGIKSVAVEGIMSMKQGIQTANHGLTAIKNTVKTVTGQLGNIAKANVERLKVENAELHEQNEELQNKNNKLEGENRELRKENDELRQQIEELKKSQNKSS